MWRLFAVAEGFFKTISAILQKMVGVAMGTLEMGCIAAAFIGAVQAASGFCWALTKRDPEVFRALIPSVRDVLGLVLLGFFAGIFGTVLSIYSFTLGADMGVRTLLLSASIVPASVAAAFMWPQTDSLDLRQYGGIGVFLIAMWAMLGFPDMSQLLALKSWVWLVLLMALVAAGSELLSRVMALRFSAWANNFWVGISTTFFSLVGLVVLALQGEVTLTLTRTFTLGIVAIGFVVVAMITFKVWAYQGGGTIALKKIIMPGTYLLTAVLAGAVLYGEPITLGKMVGAVLWFGSVALIDKRAAHDLRALWRQ